jgi:hypothetical protein
MIEIRPSNIDASKHLFSTPWENGETETSAGWIVRFCQERDGDDWRPYDHADLLAYYRERRLLSINRDYERSNVKAQERYDIAKAAYDVKMAALDSDAENAAFDAKQIAYQDEQTAFQTAVTAFHADVDNKERGPFPAYPKLRPPTRTTPHEPTLPRLKAPLDSTQETFCYNRLPGYRHHPKPWVFEGDDGLMHITPEFAKICFSSRPIATCPGSEAAPETLDETG